MEKVVVISGFPQHGKNTLGDAISEWTGRQTGDCSSIIYELEAERRGISVYKLREMPKDKIRKDLIKTGDKACELDIAVFPKTLFDQGARVITGIRRREELLDFKEYCRDDQVLSIWIKREVPFIKDNTEDLSDLCDIQWNNEGDIPHMKDLVRQLF